MNLVGFFLKAKINYIWNIEYKLVILIINWLLIFQSNNRMVLSGLRCGMNQSFISIFKWWKNF